MLSRTIVQGLGTAIDTDGSGLGHRYTTRCGGTGFIGKQLAHFLRWNGYEVTVVSRKPLKNGLTWEYVDRHGLPKRTAAVINLAGENVLDFTKRWNPSFRDSVYDSRVKTTCTLAKAIDNAVDKPCTFIVMSGVGIYPPSATMDYDEYTPTYEYDFLSKLVHHWEDAAELKNPGCCRTVKIRSGVVLGREGGMIKNLYVPYFFGLGGRIGDGLQYLPWIHIDDLIQLFFFCMKNNVEGVLNGVSPNTITNSQFTRAFAKAMRRPALFPVPGFVMNLLLGKERAVMLTHGQCVTPKRTIEYGFQYKYCDIEHACKAVSYLIPKNFR